MRLARLLEPLDAVDSLIEQRLRGVQCRTWLELDKQLEASDESYEWYTAGRALRRAPELQVISPMASNELERAPVISHDLRLTSRALRPRPRAPARRARLAPGQPLPS